MKILRGIYGVYMRVKAVAEEIQ